ncbi:MAG TPA: hypothetical protein PLU43_06890, partial [Lachnospiraceae bacterium]|nr:hypothetical protein [Lachnospiraceae bacterium]
NTVAEYLYPELSCEQINNHLLEEMVKKGLNGTSTQKGFYNYTEASVMDEEKERDNKMLAVLKLSS